MLILSSQVAVGHVGLSAALPVLHRLGRRVTALPTVLLSNHPGFAHVAGGRVPPADLTAMVGALAANGWLAGHDAVLTGYLPSAAHVDVAVATVVQLRALNPQVQVIVDPVLGDAPKGLYLAAEAAEALRDRLLPLADVLTPNLFELGWLTGSAPATLAEATVAARGLAPRVLVTSAPMGAGDTGVLELVGGDAGTGMRAGGAVLYRAPRCAGVPQGVGDVFAALVAAGLTTGAALGHLDALIRASLWAPHLRIVETAEQWSRALPLLPEEHAHGL